MWACLWDVRNPTSPCPLPGISPIWHWVIPIEHLSCARTHWRGWGGVRGDRITGERSVHGRGGIGHLSVESRTDGKEGVRRAFKNTQGFRPVSYYDVWRGLKMRYRSCLLDIRCFTCGWCAAKRGLCRSHIFLSLFRWRTGKRWRIRFVCLRGVWWGEDWGVLFPTQRLCWDDSKDSCIFCHPAYVALGSKCTDVAEVLGNGADGAIIGSELIRKINSGIWGW